MNLGDNCLSRDGYLSLIRAVASKGFRGKFQTLTVRDQNPGYASHEELLELYHIGQELGLRVICDEMTATEEISYELSHRKNTDAEDILQMRKIFQDIVSDDRTEVEDILTTSYKKTVYM